MDEIDACSVCNETYGVNLRPRCLPCGHSYCTDCIGKLIRNGNLSCPACNRRHGIRNASKVAVNYDLEKCFSRIAEIRGPKDPAPPPIRGKNMAKLVKEQKSAAGARQALAEEMESELREYDKFLCDSVREHEKVARKLHALAERHETLVKVMKEERERISKAQEEVDHFSKELSDTLQTLEAAVTNDNKVAPPTDLSTDFLLEI